MIYSSLILTLLFIGPALAAIAHRRSLSIGGHLLLFGICIFYGVFPLLVAWGGLHLTERFGCEAEAIIFNCPAPSWHGDLVTGMVFAHWIAIATIPSAIFGSIGLVSSLILKFNSSSKKVTISKNPTAAFYRSRRHKVIAGVCSAIARQRKLPIQGVRIVTVILAIILPGLILLLYLFLWLAFPLDMPIKSHLVAD
ncbi:PspC domain-containing protein [Nodularia harveyana UHCC-0300]|uniref:PspC domain-containing protein n=1 Tax=Nodularia harveyana UHCC-0300 TaxID=2974287 RepID=A0ABU5UAK6_9CYAN|nr:PspC domain-containing protein [Nodularia harveyana]MEA5580194.1 PspC domain-containing protein [Nodularia harveyana UHCC-0300]